MQPDRPVWRSRAWIAAVCAPLLVALVLMTTGADGPTTALIILAVATMASVAVVIWAFSRVRSQRRSYEHELEAWARERAAQAERLRIAADLHDLVSHGLGAITVRAATARRLRVPDGDAERSQALADIEGVSRETTLELRRMLAVLRDGSAAPLRPSETLGDLPEIIDRATRAGLRVNVRADDVGPVSPGAQLTVCAVVREALANTVRHAGPTSASVSLRREAGVVVVDIRNDAGEASWHPNPGAGHGLDGLRQRVASHGGTLRAASDDGGYSVSASIPDPAG